MANTPPRSEAEREVRNIEAHVDNVAERRLSSSGHCEEFTGGT